MSLVSETKYPPSRNETLLHIVPLGPDSRTLPANLLLLNVWPHVIEVWLIPHVSSTDPQLQSQLQCPLENMTPFQIWKTHSTAMTSGIAKLEQTDANYWDR